MAKDKKPLARKKPLKTCPRCGALAELIFGPDPYNSEVNNDNTPVEQCQKCYADSADDV